MVEAISQTSGFTPGFASVLVCEDGSRHFVKAASVKAQRMFADSYREEARKLAALPASVPAPRLLWMLDDDWVVLGIEHVEAAPPSRPWRQADLDADPGRAGGGRRRADPGADRAGHLLETSSPRSSTAGRTSAPRTTCRTSTRPRPGPAATPRSARGDTLVHTDIRDDNVLVDAAGAAWLCDWNWPVAGAPWLDSLFTAHRPARRRPRRGRRDRLAPAPARRAGRARRHRPGAGRRLLPLRRDQPVPPTSPHIRDHQRWQGEVCWDWLCERRGWV